MNENEVIQTHIKALTIFDANNQSMTVDECAKFLKIHRNTVINRIENKKIIALSLGKGYSIPKLQFISEIIESWNQPHTMLT